MTAAGCDIVVLAGDRGPGDPLAASAGVAGKVLVPIGGRPMIERVLEAVAGASATGRIVAVCPGSAAYLEVLSAHGVDERIDPGAGPAASAASAISASTATST